jgi:hypothetical protein
MIVIQLSPWVLTGLPAGLFFGWLLCKWDDRQDATRRPGEYEDGAE